MAGLATHTRYPLVEDARHAVSGLDAVYNGIACRARHAAIASRADKRITYVTRHDASGKPIDDDCDEILTLN